MMSNAQVPYLQNLITKKLRRDSECLRKLVGHAYLWSRLQPFTTVADYDLSESTEVPNFEDQISIRCNCERLAALALDDGQNHTQTTTNKEEMG
jgi:hypothetical protein